MRLYTKSIITDTIVSNKAGHIFLYFCSNPRSKIIGKCPGLNEWRVWFSDGPWSDLTRAYFWSPVNKRLTWLWPGYFLTQPKAIFLTRGEKNLKIWDFWGKFSKPKPKPKMADPTRAAKNWPDLTQVKVFRPEPITSLGHPYNPNIWNYNPNSPCWVRKLRVSLCQIYGQNLVWIQYPQIPILFAHRFRELCQNQTRADPYKSWALKEY